LRWLDPWAEEDPILSLKDFGQGCTVYLYDREDSEHTNKYCQMDDIVIQQYTEMKDCDGVEIYEGDLVTVYDKKIYEVKWGKTYNGFQYNLYDKDDYLDDYYGGIGDNRCLKVIGNIFENPRYFDETT
jgi:hypothetical protein